MRKRAFAVAFPILVVFGLTYLSTQADTVRSQAHTQRDPGTLVPNQPTDGFRFPRTWKSACLAIQAGGPTS